MKCGPDEPSWTWTKIWVQACMPDYSLNGQQSPMLYKGDKDAARPPEGGQAKVSLKSAVEHWPSNTDARQSAEKPLHKAQSLIKQYLMNVPPDGWVWHKTIFFFFFRCVWEQSRGPDTPGSSKNASGSCHHSPKKRAPQAPGDKPKLSKKG